MVARSIPVLELSLQRAERVKADLVSQGIAPGRIRTAGRGEREPVVTTEDGVDEPLMAGGEVELEPLEPLTSDRAGGLRADAAAVARFLNS